MEALRNRLARWIPKPLDGLRVNGQFDKIIIWGLLADGGESCGSEAFCWWPCIEHDQASNVAKRKKMATSISCSSSGVLTSGLALSADSKAFYMVCTQVRFICWDISRFGPIANC
ncbi:hypothetical protein VPH35_052949 [Triticum aestivum]